MIGIAYAAPNCPAKRKPDLDSVVVVQYQVGRSHEIEGDDEHPKQRTYLYGEKRQHCQYPGRQVPVGGEHGETEQRDWGRRRLEG